MRYSAKQLDKKRGRRKVGHTNTNQNVAKDLALFCSKDDYLMQPALEPADPTGRTTKRALLYVCPACGNIINPNTDNATHGMTVQTRDKAITYRGKQRTIASSPNRSHEKKPEDAMQKFINDPQPYLDKFGVTVTKRTIIRSGKKFFKLAV